MRQAYVLITSASRQLRCSASERRAVSGMRETSAARTCWWRASAALPCERAPCKPPVTDVVHNTRPQHRPEVVRGKARQHVCQPRKGGRRAAGLDAALYGAARSHGQRPDILLQTIPSKASHAKRSVQNLDFDPVKRLHARHGQHGARRAQVMVVKGRAAQRERAQQTRKGRHA